MANKKKIRYASISLATKNAKDGGYNYDPFGVILGDEDYPGSASILIEIDTDKKETIQTQSGDREVPVRAKLVACKFLAPSGEEILVDMTDSFINATFWHAMERSPKAKD